MATRGQRSDLVAQRDDVPKESAGCSKNEHGGAPDREGARSGGCAWWIAWRWPATMQQASLRALENPAEATDLVGPGQIRGAHRRLRRSVRAQPGDCPIIAYGL
jgi:hypothetical protein